MDKILHLIGREKQLFTKDIENNISKLQAIIFNSSFLVLGAAGTIGQSVTKEIFKRYPKKLHLVDISENNLVELVRDLRSTYGYIDGEFKTFALDIGSLEYDVFIKNDGKYDYVLNLSALKHVRSEKDPYTLMRMIDVNIINTYKTLQQSIDNGVKKYFCVSTDKAANPSNLMGASKKIMEMCLMKKSLQINISTARFANVAFSDGSLLQSFNQRIEKKQPIVAPNDIWRYFITPQESGELCLMSCIFGKNRDIFFPKISKKYLTTFPNIALKLLQEKNYLVHECKNEAEARSLVKILPKQGFWPCYFSASDTTGEKEVEEFYVEKEVLDMEQFYHLGVIKNKVDFNESLISHFINTIQEYKQQKYWTKEQIVGLFLKTIPSLDYEDTGKYLDDKM